MKTMGRYIQTKTNGEIFCYNDEIFRSEKEFSNALAKRGFSSSVIMQIVDRVKSRVYTSDEFAAILEDSGRSTQSIKRLVSGVARKKK